ncbi:MAG: hypothetical protein GF400_01770 [Candidatus Eisenbacteria bacterium]|nr:hypothetical protein [Candidatus Eisenbacteria bacterium]
MRLLRQLNAFIWSFAETFRSLRRGVAVAPFAVYAAVQLLLTAGVVWFAYPPMSSTIAPALRWRLGEAALHYPANLFALRPALAQADSVLMIFLGAVLTAAAVHMFASFYSGGRDGFAAGWRAAVGRYVPLALVAAVLMLVTHLVARAPFTFTPGLAERSPALFRILRLGGLLLVVVIQSLFVYTAPYLVLRGRSLISAVTGSFRLAAVMPLTTLLIVGIPAAFELLPLWLTRQSRTIATRMAPEFLIWIMVLWIAVIFFAGYFTTGASTRMFLHATQEEMEEGGGA